MKASNPLWIIVFIYSLAFAGIPIMGYYNMPGEQEFNIRALLISNCIAWLYPTIRAVIKMTRHLTIRREEPGKEGAK